MTAPVTHSADNYSLGKGIGYFDKMENGNYTGEMDLGNCSALTWNVDVEKLAHFSSRSGMRKKDKEITVQVTPRFTATADELTPDLMSMMGMGEITRMVQAAGESSVTVTTKKNRYFKVGTQRNIGITVLQYKNGDSAWNLDATVSGATGSGTIVGIEITSGTPAGGDEAGYLLLQSVTPGFVADEAITDDGTTPGSGDAVAPESFDSTRFSVREGSTEYVRGTDFSVDGTTGRIFILADSTIADDTSVTVYYGYEATEWSQIKCYEDSQIEGAFRFVQDNPTGINKSFYAPKVSVAPSGDVPLVGEDWETITLEFEVLADANGDYIFLDIPDEVVT